MRQLFRISALTVHLRKRREDLERYRGRVMLGDLVKARETGEPVPDEVMEFLTEAARGILQDLKDLEARGNGASSTDIQRSAGKRLMLTNSRRGRPKNTSKKPEDAAGFHIAEKVLALVETGSSETVAIAEVSKAVFKDRDHVRHEWHAHREAAESAANLRKLKAKFSEMSESFVYPDGEVKPD